MALDKALAGRINRLAKKIYLIDSLGGVCEHCGDDRFYVMNFHHVLDNVEKSFNFCGSTQNRLSTLIAESEKCIILCYNCHQKHHMKTTNVDKRRTNTKRILFEYMGTSACKCCGESESRILHFHHVRNKIISISQWITNKNIKTIDELNDLIKTELDKCILLCPNCHAETHLDKDFNEKYLDLIIKKSKNLTENIKPLDRELVKQMFLDGMQQIDIAKHFHSAKSTISDILKSFGLTISMADKSYDRQKLVELHTKGYSNIEISEELGMRRNTVSRIINELGLKPNIKKARVVAKFDLTKDDLLQELKYLSIKDIMKKYNVALQTVYVKMRKYEIKPK